ncbi:hypothetical protein E4U43_004400 [Claviceps pusilla]|uniref:Uncharacterized protein n=1 Tax=Claviceps pusilla TaxID=123648 RepID=A0A9P7SWX4_9HYPO|nr:hypothetical protein E4U43_004400 [Claviceps pusilla]
MAATFGVLDAIGLFMSGLGIFSFVQHNFLDYVPPGANFRFALGLNGAGPFGEGLQNADGTLPDIRVFNALGDEIGKTINDDTYCKDGVVCDSLVPWVQEQPVYTLFTANADAICIAWVTATFPEGDKYAWTGNFGRYCPSATWYYSDIYVQNDHGADKVACTWIDKNGDQPTTGIQVSWPAYASNFNGNGGKADFYCSQGPALFFHQDQDPWRIKTLPQKRNMFASNPSVEEKAFAPKPKDAKPKKAGYNEHYVHDTRLVKSHANSHKASELCESKTSVGPSFVSYKERKFCHMATKKLHSFCEDVKTGTCWDDVKHEIVHKDENGAVKRSVNPALPFNKVILWGQ